MGVRIRRERVARGLTQEKLAELSDLNIRTLQKIEAGQINILVTTAVRIRVALGSEWREIMP
jgi:transcriptional regulator with XRE-family HTH domain